MYYDHYAEAFEKCYKWSMLIFSNPDDSNSGMRKNLPLHSFILQNLTYSEIKQIRVTTDDFIKKLYFGKSFPPFSLENYFQY